jgi:hypothetical protein
MARKMTPSEEIAFYQTSPSNGSTSENSGSQIQQILIRNALETKTSATFPDELPYVEEEDWF